MIASDQFTVEKNGEELLLRARALRVQGRLVLAIERLLGAADVRPILREARQQALEHEILADKARAVHSPLGGVTKGGTTNMVEVYEYAEPVTARGLVFMDTPGFDPVSATGQVAGGANLICFTTGRGSAYGCQPSPSLKIATNTELWQRQQDDMDINCGEILERWIAGASPNSSADTTPNTAANASVDQSRSV